MLGLINLLMRLLSEKQKQYLYSEENINRMRKLSFKKGNIPFHKGKKIWENKQHPRGNLGKKKTPEELKRMSLRVQGEKNPMFGIRVEKAVERMKSERNPIRCGQVKMSRTKPEIRIIELMEKYKLPYRYTGEGELWIGSINPDFIHSFGKKKIIEVFGNYWHDPTKIKNLSFQRTEEGRKKILSKAGWDCLIIWEKEIKEMEEESIVKIIRSFTDRKS